MENKIQQAVDSEQPSISDACSSEVKRIDCVKSGQDSARR